MTPERLDRADVQNRQFVGSQGDRIVILMPRLSMTREEALLHAAWLVLLAEREPDEFEFYLEAVRST